MANYLITGCSRGLGLALVMYLASLPPSVNIGTIFATARLQTPALESLTTSHSNGKVIFIPSDTTSEPSISAAVLQVSHALGSNGLDVLINNAGIMPYTPAGIHTMTDLSSTISTNVTSAHMVTAAFLPLLRLGALKKVIIISSTMDSMARAAKFPFPTPAYKVSKAALNMLTVQYALAFADEGFTFVALSPGWLQTDMGTGDADLPVEVGARAVLEKVWNATREDNGKFLDIHVAG